MNLLEKMSERSFFMLSPEGGWGRGMPKLAPEKQQARREHILDAAERCFICKGFHPATMDDICREAGVSPGAVYTYFASKEDLIAGLCDREKERFSKELARMAGSSDFLAALQAMAEHYCCHEPIEKVRLHVEIGAEAGRNRPSATRCAAWTGP